MTDKELIARLRKRADEERVIQKNNEAVAAALKGQRLLFDQGIRSAANTFAVRLGLDHEKCAENDAKLARDWDEAADRIEALIAENKRLGQQCEGLMQAGMNNGQALIIAENKLGKAVEALEQIQAHEEKDWVTRSGKAPPDVQGLCDIARADRETYYPRR